MKARADFPKIIDVSTDNETNDTYLKAFLIDDSINANFWHIPNEYMKKYANAFIGRPLIRHPSGSHPDYIKEGAILSSENFIQDIFNIQDKYKIGEIVDVNYENRKGRKDKAWYATIRMTNPEATTNAFLDSFVRGNRDDQPRTTDGSILQALNLMNATLVENKLAFTGATAGKLMTDIAQLTGASNTDVVNKLYLNILSRYPSSSEMSTALASLPTGNGTTRNNAIQDLAWSLFNKVDFVFNY